MKKGLVMEGGAMRGMFTAGVIDVMMEHQITFDGAMGVSAGAVFGCNYKSNQPGRVIRYNAAYCNKPQYAGLRTFLKTGICSGNSSVIMISRSILIRLIMRLTARIRWIFTWW